MPASAKLVSAFHPKLPFRAPSDRDGSGHLVRASARTSSPAPKQCCKLATASIQVHGKSRSSSLHHLGSDRWTLQHNLGKFDRSSSQIRSLWHLRSRRLRDHSPRNISGHPQHLRSLSSSRPGVPMKSVAPTFVQRPPATKLRPRCKRVTQIPCAWLPPSRANPPLAARQSFGIGSTPEHRLAGSKCPVSTQSCHWRGVHFRQVCDIRSEKSGRRTPDRRRSEID